MRALTALHCSRTSPCAVRRAVLTDSRPLRRRANVRINPIERKGGVKANRRCVKLVGVPCHEGFVALPYLQGLDQTLLDLSRLSSAERISAGKD